MASHRYRNPATHGAVRNRFGRWQAQKTIGGRTAGFGTFDTPERASLAVRLFEHWMSRGYYPEDVPRQPRTRDAI